MWRWVFFEAYLYNGGALVVSVSGALSVCPQLAFAADGGREVMLCTKLTETETETGGLAVIGLPPVLTFEACRIHIGGRISSFVI